MELKLPIRQGKCALCKAPLYTPTPVYLQMGQRGAQIIDKAREVCSTGHSVKHGCTPGHPFTCRRGNVEFKLLTRQGECARQLYTLTPVHLQMGQHEAQLRGQGECTSICATCKWTCCQWQRVRTLLSLLLSPSRMVGFLPVIVPQDYVTHCTKCSGCC